MNKRRFNQTTALETGRARTRDGRAVDELQVAMLPDGEVILVGNIWRPGESDIEGHYWLDGGRGFTGQDDLMNCPKVYT